MIVTSLGYAFDEMKVEIGYYTAKQLTRLPVMLGICEIATC